MKRAKETVEMGWSEKYWEDVKSELEHAATEPAPASEDETLGQPVAPPAARPAPDPNTTGQA